VVATNIFAPTPKIPPKLHFGGPFNAKPITERALRKSHINGATKLKLYSYIGIGKYLGACQNFFAGLLNVNLGPPIISETTRARKLNLKIPLAMVMYPLWLQKLLYYTTQHEAVILLIFDQSMSPRQTMANDKMALSLHVVESASDDYNF